MKKSILITAVLFLAVISSSFAEKKYQNPNGFNSPDTGINSLLTPWEKLGTVSTYSEKEENGKRNVTVNCLPTGGICVSAEGTIVTIHTDLPPTPIIQETEETIILEYDTNISSGSGF